MSEWQPIETAPKDGTPILAVIPERWELVDIDVWPVWWSQAWVSGWYTVAGETEGQPDGGWIAVETRVNPTHWMPLPEPPENDAEQRAFEERVAAAHVLERWPENAP